jgi:hypothetical protein
MAARSFNRSLRDGESDEEDSLSVELRAEMAGKSTGIGARLDAWLKGAPGGGASRLHARPQKAATHASDPRQRAIVKVHYYKHAGGGAAALGAHGAYIEREGAQLAAEMEPLVRR